MARLDGTADGSYDDCRVGGTICQTGESRPIPERARIHRIRIKLSEIGESPCAIFRGLIAAHYVGNVMLLILGPPLVALFMRILYTSMYFLLPLIMMVPSSAFTVPTRRCSISYCFAVSA